MLALLLVAAVCVGFMVLSPLFVPYGEDSGRAQGLELVSGALTDGSAASGFSGLAQVPVGEATA